MKPRKPYPTDISDEEWAFAAPYLTLMDAQAPQRKYALRAMF
ncbi:transposase, partial [Xanthomonas hortorum]|nr:IS5/IS1182 family transposase [Xanthomonas hortorum pv. gardneri]MCE4372362.1 IS5/IS1182 family transposase [Xanthomonas hortorum pv. hederae]MCE4315295.1 IS5/IS1182 family transposase [Xanthomonas hortorum pv. gardneri]MCE4315403.1 IS5/IS1182 family transposase [Xanthomonas hortorum pv. gardneri]MCE4315948.1 IS5/IS1182 family transposase [Xanthomonas hortorum pv. gardneri]